MPKYFKNGKVNEDMRNWHENKIMKIGLAELPLLKHTSLLINLPHIICSESLSKIIYGRKTRCFFQCSILYQTFLKILAHSLGAIVIDVVSSH